MAEFETFHHELSQREYGVLIDAQFAAIASVVPVDAFKNNVPIGLPESVRELWWCDEAGKHVALNAEHMGTYNIHDVQPGQPRMRKVVRLLTRVTGENPGDGFYQDVQLVGMPGGGHSYDLFEFTSPDDLAECQIPADEILWAVGRVASKYVEYVTHGSQVAAFAPEFADHKLPA